VVNKSGDDLGMLVCNIIKSSDVVGQIVKLDGRFVLGMHRFLFPPAYRLFSAKFIELPIQEALRRILIFPEDAGRHADAVNVVGQRTFAINKKVYHFLHIVH